MYLKQIEQLVVLQKVDGEMVGLQEELEQAPREIAKLEERNKELDASKESIREKLEFLRVQHNRLHTEIEDDSVKLKKSKSKLMLVGNTKEYHAMMREMDNLEKLNRMREEERTALEEEIERQELSLKELEDGSSSLQKELQEGRANLEARMKAAKERLDELEAIRSTAAHTVPKPILKRYEFIRSRLHNPVIVAVDAGICSGCNISIPPQTFIELQKGEQILSCPNCQRLIFWTQHVPEAVAKKENDAASAEDTSENA
ncbi:zinc ribbon domain-containing protein [Desulfovibrio inopinatus]|uniref:zinc ribbon domain-containing protein n=1 Tax=Desulfovibrio inopinatus TaxID=102109 RepID=UPI000487AB66|nr:C4-type zinc ribbon domain-containing protein [Desulfovibrio inopinatus]